MSYLMNSDILDLSREDQQNFADQDNEQKLKEAVESSTAKESHELNNNLSTDGIYKPGHALREKEHTFFARILDFSQFKLATRAQVQEQWAVKVPRSEQNASEGSIRARKVTKRNGKTHYELTVKNKVSEGSIEVTVPTTEAMFFQIRALSEQGMMKHRYTFPIKGTGLKWEVDAVPDGNGGYYPWVRIEIEVKDLKDKVPEIPIKTEELIMPPHLSNMTPEEHQAKTQPLMDRFFLTKNPFATEQGEEGNETKLMGRADDESESDSNEGKVDDAKPEDGEADNTDASVEEKKEEAKEAVLSVDNITDDKETADKVETRAEQIKEAKGINDGDEGDETTPEGEDDSGGDTEGDGDDGDADSDAADEEDSGDSESDEGEADESEPGWDEPAADSGEKEGKDGEKGEVAKESFAAVDAFQLDMEAFEAAMAHGLPEVKETVVDNKVEIEVEVGGKEVEITVEDQEPEEEEGSESESEGSAEEETQPESTEAEPETHVDENDGFPQDGWNWERHVDDEPSAESMIFGSTDENQAEAEPTA